MLQTVVRNQCPAKTIIFASLFTMTKIGIHTKPASLFSVRMPLQCNHTYLNLINHMVEISQDGYFFQIVVIYDFDKGSNSIYNHFKRLNEASCVWPHNKLLR